MLDLGEYWVPSNGRVSTIVSRVAALLVGAFVLILVGSQASARNCEDDSIQEVSDSGEIIIMLSGRVYEVFGGDQADSALWLGAEVVLVCEQNFTYQGKRYLTYEIINTDERGEKVSAMRLR